MGTHKDKYKMQATITITFLSCPAIHLLWYFITFSHIIFSCPETKILIYKKGGALAKEVAGKGMDVVINVVKKKI